ncbi:hypothetical protein EPYR_02747 [Erwinia pyrifoliae DSM 12163]|nr:hypothetical protein EPYR_02747 [Erwinia pyrifoliae DSM 12163]
MQRIGSGRTFLQHEKMIWVIATRRQPTWKARTALAI